MCDKPEPFGSADLHERANGELWASLYCECGQGPFIWTFDRS